MDRSRFLGSLACAMALTASLALGACKRAPAGASPEAAESAAPSPTASEHTDEPPHETLPKTVRVSPDVVAAAKIRTAPVVRDTLDAVLELPGEIASDPDKTADVSAPIAGRIERVAFAEGQTVAAHALLAVLRVPEIAEQQAAIGSLRARASAARSNANRLEALEKKGLAAAQEVADAKAQAAALESEARAAGERLRAIDPSASQAGGARVEIRAPIAGTVVSRDAVIGQLADPQHPIARIVDMKEVWFLGRVFERDLARVRVGAKAEVTVNAYPDDRFRGTIEYVGRQIDPAARTVTARVRLDNADGRLRIGLFGTARISRGETQGSEARLVVPRDAVTDIGGKPVVFVQEPDGDFGVHEVVVGPSALDKTQIFSGLREGENVVVDGVFTLKSLVLKSTFGEEE